MTPSIQWRWHHPYCGSAPLHSYRNSRRAGCVDVGPQAHRATPEQAHLPADAGLQAHRASLEQAGLQAHHATPEQVSLPQFPPALAKSVQ
jgi:hypothetical protein